MWMDAIDGTILACKQRGMVVCAKMCAGIFIRAAPTRHAARDPMVSFSCCIASNIIDHTRKTKEGCDESCHQLYIGRSIVGVEKKDTC